MTFDWQGDSDRIVYGTAPGAYTHYLFSSPPAPVPDGPGPFHEARLTGLLENQLYYYRIGGVDNYCYSKFDHLRRAHDDHRQPFSGKRYPRRCYGQLHVSYRGLRRWLQGSDRDS